VKIRHPLPRVLRRLRARARAMLPRVRFAIAVAAPLTL